MASQPEGEKLCHHVDDPSSYPRVDVNSHTKYHQTPQYWIDFFWIASYFYAPILVVFIPGIPYILYMLFGIHGLLLGLTFWTVYFISICKYSRKHIISKGSPFFRDPKKNPIWDASCRYFDPKIIIQNHSQLVATRQHAVESLKTISNYKKNDKSEQQQLLSLDTPYVEYFLTSQQLKQLKSGEAVEPLHINNPDFILERQTLQLCPPAPPEALISLLQQNNSVVVPTLSSAFIFGHHPHGLYPFTSLWLHHHPDFAPMRDRIDNEITRLKEQGEPLPSIQMVPDQCERERPVLPRYELVKLRTDQNDDEEDQQQQHVDMTTFIPPVFLRHRVGKKKYNTSHPSRVDALATSALTFTPIIREIFTAIGGGDVSAKSYFYRLMTNTSCYFFPAGQRELDTSDGYRRDHIFYSNHFGFVKMALKTGTPLVPIICFGEEQLLTAFKAPFISKLLYKLVWLSLPIYPHGAYYGLTPNNIPLTVIVGAPIFVPLLGDNVDPSIITYYHSIFYSAIVKMYFEYRAQAGFADSKLILQ